jgi:hypothetical protein
MKHWNKYTAQILFLGIALFISSCKTSRQTGQIALTAHTKTEKVGLILSQALPYQTFSGNLRFSVKLGSDRGNVTTDAQLKIIKNEMIQLSLRIPFLGTEAARINISPEQVTIVDRINKMYFTESMENLKNRFPFDFDYYSLQSLFTNQLFIAGKQELMPADYVSFDYREDEFSATLNQQDSRGIIYDFVSDYSHRIQQTAVYKSDKAVDMTWDYSDFGRTSGNRLFPMKMKMALTVSTHLIAMDLNFSSVTIDTPFELKVEIPQKYKAIDWEQAVRLITN